MIKFNFSFDSPVVILCFLFFCKILGISKYFQMACIIEKLAASLNKEVTAKGIWDHLSTMYDLNKLVSDRAVLCLNLK